VDFRQEGCSSRTFEARRSVHCHAGTIRRHLLAVRPNSPDVRHRLDVDRTEHRCGRCPGRRPRRPDRGNRSCACADGRIVDGCWHRAAWTGEVIGRQGSTRSLGYTGRDPGPGPGTWRWPVRSPDDAGCRCTRGTCRGLRFPDVDPGVSGHRSVGTVQRLEHLRPCDEAGPALRGPDRCGCVG
jgi:hypothetical protein